MLARTVGNDGDVVNSIDKSRDVFNRIAAKQLRGMRVAAEGRFFCCPWTMDNSIPITTTLYN